MKKCKVVNKGNGFEVRGTNFLHRCDADRYAYYLANTLNAGGKLIHVTGEEDAIQKHNQLEGPSNDNWLRLAWRRNEGSYLDTRNMYALKDNSLHDNLYQWYKNSDQWWEYMSNETKCIISGINSQDTYNVFWTKLKSLDKDRVHEYWRYRKGLVMLEKDRVVSLQIEIICELADLQLEAEYNKRREDMCDHDGSFLDEYQNRFNDIYDDIEERLSRL